MASSTIETVIAILLGFGGVGIFIVLAITMSVYLPGAASLADHPTRKA